MTNDYAHEWTDKQLEKLERSIAKEYRTALKELKQKQADFMKGYEVGLSNKKRQLARGEISKLEYDQWLNSQALRSTWLNDMVNSCSKIANNTNKAAIDMVNGSMAGFYAENYNWGTYQIENGTKINTAFSLVDTDTVRGMLAENPRLLPKYNLDSLKDIRWNNQKFNSAILQGILQGESIPDISKRLKSVMQMNHNSAVRNARTATTAAENKGRVDSYKRAEKMGIEVKKEWLATLDGRTRHSHRQLDGVSVGTDEKFDNGCRFPGDPQAPGFEVYNCRCTLIANLPDVDTSGAPRDSKLGNMSYDEWKNGKKSANQNTATGKDGNIAKDCAKSGIKYNPVKRIGEQLSYDQIIEKIGGGDMTGGSCSSLAFCYAGNKAGLDVRDFRGGDSRTFFSRVGNIRKIANIEGVESQIIKHKNDISAVGKLVKNVEVGKEYYLSTGRHAAIIRRSDIGGKEVIEYLELQSATNNGWKRLTESTLKNRFRCQKSHTISGIKYEAENILIDIDSLNGNAEFEELLGYINTSAGKELKGARGTIK